MCLGIFGGTRDNVEATGDWRRLHNEELYDLYSSPNVILVIKSRKMRWAGHMERMGESRSLYGVLVGKSEGPEPGVDGKIILEEGMWGPRLD